MSLLDNLLPASFRGVTFLVESHTYASGRRVAKNEFPLKDGGTAQDLGRRLREFQLRAFLVIGPNADDYTATREQLRTACEGTQGPGLLNHPWLGGNISVQCETFRFVETLTELGLVAFDITFCEPGPKGPSVAADTSAQVTSGVGSLLGTLNSAIAIANQVEGDAAILVPLAQAVMTGNVGAIVGLLGNIVPLGSTLGLAAATITGIVNTVTTAIGLANTIGAALTGPASQVTSAYSGLVGDPVTVAVLDTYLAASDAVLAATAAAQSQTDPVAGQLYTLQRMLADPTLGMAALASYANALPAPTGLQVTLQTSLQQNLVLLVQGAATLAVLRIYAGTDFTSYQQAIAARTQMQALINAQILLAAAADQDALYQAWMTLGGQAAADLLARAQQLPLLTSYSTPQMLPACVLAQRFYQDATRASELVLLNDAIHPGFMPTSGVALAS